MSQSDDTNQPGKCLRFTYVLCQLSAFCTVLLTGVWMGLFNGGFGPWFDSDCFDYTSVHSPLQPPVCRQWQQHGIVMLVALVFIRGEVVVLLRTYAKSYDIRRPWIAVLYGCSNAVIVGLNVIGIAAVVLYKVHLLVSNYPLNAAHLYTAHSWLGIVTILLYILEVLLSCGLCCVCRLVPWRRGIGVLVRTRNIIGLLGFLLACTTAVCGLVQQTSTLITQDAAVAYSFSTLTAEGLIVNGIVLSITLYAVTAAGLLWMAVQNNNQTDIFQLNILSFVCRL